MKSVIVNMADRKKDAEDLRLEALFASESVPDNGFSARIEKRIRRQLWVRRLALPTAVLVGGLIAAKPLSGLVVSLTRLATQLPTQFSDNLSFLPAEGITKGGDTLSERNSSKRAQTPSLISTGCSELLVFLTC